MLTVGEKYWYPDYYFNKVDNFCVYSEEKHYCLLIVIIPLRLSAKTGNSMRYLKVIAIFKKVCHGLGVTF